MKRSLNLLVVLGCLICVVLAVRCSSHEAAKDGGADGGDGGNAVRYSKAFSSSEDFDQGIKSGVNDTAQPGQLQMNGGKTEYQTPYIWISNCEDGCNTQKTGSVTQYDTRTNPPKLIETVTLKKGNQVCMSPSRTTVNQDLDVWIGCRNSKNIVKVSHDENLHGEDKIMMFVQLDKAPRGLAIDADRKVWIGCGDCDPNPFTDGWCSGSVDDKDPVYKIDEQTGECLMGDISGCKKPALQVADWPYGAAVDQRGYLWMVSNHHWTSGTLTKINTKTDSIVGAYRATIANPTGGGVCANFYGVAIDRLGDVWLGNLGCNDVLKFNGQTGQQIGRFDAGGKDTRGVAVTNDGDIWVACSGTSTVSKLRGDTGELMAEIGLESLTPKGTVPIGPGVDAYGALWVVCQNTDNVFKFIETSPGVFAHQAMPVGRIPYTYSDMLGSVLFSITLRQDGKAYWTINYDSGTLKPTWDKIKWVAQTPGDSKISARTRCAADEPSLYNATWSEYITQSDSPIICPTLQWIQVEVQFEATAKGSPVLKDLTVEWIDNSAVDNVKFCERWITTVKCGTFDPKSVVNCDTYANLSCDIAAYFECLTANFKCTNDTADISGWDPCTPKASCN